LRELLEDNLRHPIPSTSPNYYPLDYFVLGASELCVNNTFHNNFDTLVDKMKESMDSLNRDTVKAYLQFSARINTVVTAVSNFIE
jgi:hypothetical protein